MWGRRALGRSYGWLWTAYAVSAYGTGLAFGAFGLIAIVVLHAGPAAVSALAASGLAVGALVAVPLGPWVERHRKRPVMIATDLVRCAALATVPVAYLAGVLSVGQLAVVAVVTAAAKIAFDAAAGAHLRFLVDRDDLLVATSRFESTTWSALCLGPPLGGAAIGVFGPVVTVVADAASYLLSALGVAAIPAREPRPAAGRAPRMRAADVVEGWRHLTHEPTLRPLFANTVLVNALIMAAEPVIAVLMLGELGFPPWQYGLAFAAPCVGGLVASRLAQPLVARYGTHRVLRVSGVLRTCFPIALAAVPSGVAGLVLVMVVELGVIFSCGVFAPVLAVRRLELTPTGLTARTLTAWSITGKAAIAAFTAVWGVLAALVGTRLAIALAGALLILITLLQCRPRSTSGPGSAPRSAG